ncbi:MAG TPA: hypothetical protein VFV87_22020 [Pirellulaceae bacterium]|nr:hypothetical protein [Pirellulaceae bacterium]
MLAADDAAAWSAFSPSAQAYKVLIPGTPQEETVFQDGQNVQVVTADGELPNGLFFMVITMEIPQKGSIQRREDALQFLAGAVESYHKRPGVQVLETSEIELGKIPGRQVIADGFQGNKVRARHYAVGTQSYCLMAQSGDLELLNSDRAAKFFDSFELLNLPAEPLSEHSRAYDLGRMAGAAICNAAIVVTVIVVLFGFLRRRKRGSTP